MRRRAATAWLVGAWLAPACAGDVAAMVIADGRWRAEPRDGGRTLVLGNAGGGVQRHLPAQSLDGARRGAVTALADLPRRRSVAVGFDGLDELWEVSLDPDAPPIFDGLVHDYRMGEAIATTGFLAPRRIPIAGRVRALRAGAQAPQLLVLIEGDPPALHLVNLDVRRSLDRVPMPAGADLRAARWDDAAAPPRLRVPVGGGRDGDVAVEVGPTTLRVAAP